MVTPSDDSGAPWIAPAALAAAAACARRSGSGRAVAAHLLWAVVDEPAGGPLARDLRERGLLAELEEQMSVSEPLPEGGGDVVITSSLALAFGTAMGWAAADGRRDITATDVLVALVRLGPSGDVGDALLRVMPRDELFARLPAVTSRG